MPTSPFALVNLMELDDTLAGRIEGIEGRFARRSLDSEHLGMSHFRYSPGRRSSVGHRHGEQEEVYVVVSGSGRVLLDGEVRPLQTWDVLRVSPEVVRAFEAGPDGLELLIAGSDRPEEGDGQMGDVTWPD